MHNRNRMQRIQDETFRGRRSPDEHCHDALEFKSEEQLTLAIKATQGWLAGAQHADGYWEGELEGDSILQSEYILLLAYLNQADSARAQSAAVRLLQQQGDDGGWALFPGGSADPSASVKAYFALKLTGHSVDAPYMRRAKEACLRLGGADAVNSFTRFYLALLGQISYQQCPAVPPEMMLLPNWAPINIYRMSAWSRTIVIPLSIMWAHKPVTPIDEALGIRELFIRDPATWPITRNLGLPSSGRLWNWDRVFGLLDRVLKTLDRFHIRPLRNRGIRAAEQWMIDRFSNSDGLGAIFPPIIWSIIALRSLGYSDDSPEVLYNFAELDKLMIEQGDALRIQPCRSPVWDTTLSLRALADAGCSAETPQVDRAIEWLLDQEITQPGDWSKIVRAEPGGWCFEHNNGFYPDVDDTAMGLMALRCFSGEAISIRSDSEGHVQALLSESASDLPRARRSIWRTDRIAGAARRAIGWTLAMQNRDGGWGAFDRDNDLQLLCHVPFADHNAMIDPSTPDLTGRVLEALGQWGFDENCASVSRGVVYLRKSQEPDGSWIGRWGVNYVYGTWQAIMGLSEVGIPANSPIVSRATDWLLAHQQPDGGWGESPESYTYQELRGQGPTTASQTAWGLMGLLAGESKDRDAISRGVDYLLQRQNPDGSWLEPEFTGTGFPRVFYLRYHMYPIYFPMMALARYRKKQTLGR